MREEEPSEESQRIFAEFIRDGDEDDVSFAELCERHPDHRTGLESHWENWQLAQALLKKPPAGGGGSLAELLRAQVGSGVDPEVTLDSDAGMHVEERVMEEFARHGTGERYEFVDEVGRGAMGVVERVWDRELRRRLARKAMLDRDDQPGSTARLRRMTRFLEEAQITGQLDHPGVVPVHEIGLDSAGRLFFTMKLVKGDTLSEVFRRHRDGDEAWPLTRVLELFLRICDAMSYAASKGVLHRDLKPANVMVGRFGEVYVMDWGLAHVIDRADTKDIRIDTAVGETAEVYSSRRRELSQTGSPLLTKDGDIIGTINYMSPEQAAGRLNELGQHSDVYSVGAMLYHLLTGRVPYLDERDSGPMETLDKVLEGPPVPIAELAPDAPPELVAVAEKAMARNWRDRFESFEALGKNLRAFLDRRVVPVYATGPVAEIGKWVARNPMIAAAAVVVVFVLAGSGFVVAFQERQKAEAQRERLLAAYIARATSSWPARAESIQEMERFLDEVEELRPTAPLGPAVAHAANDEAEYGTAKYHRASARRDYEEGRRQGTEALVAGMPREDAELRGWSLDVIEHELRLLDDPFTSARMEDELPSEGEKGLEATEDEMLRDLFDETRGWVAWTRLRLEEYRRAERVSMVDNTEAWIECIRDVGLSELYDGLVLERQFGLVPLGVNEEGGLWEFWHVASGERPVPRVEGGYEIEPRTGIVLVLIPAGRFRMGMEADDVEGEKYDPRDWVDVELGAFFLSKYEMTQGQWWCVTRETPSAYVAGHHAVGTRQITRANPVENVSYEDARSVLATLDLTLPTEAQWEYAARAGTVGRYVFGDEPRALLGSANFGDASFLVASSSTPVSPSDGYVLHAPVGALQANPFGLHHTLGNVWEWCRDWRRDDLTGVEFVGADREIRGKFHLERMVRGGGYRTALRALRPTTRVPHRPDARQPDLGVRPSRPIVQHQRSETD